MAKKYRFLEHSGDALFQAFGESFSKLLENSAEAMCSVMYALKKVDAEKEVEVEAKGENKEELLHNFLGEVLFKIGEREMLFREFRVKELGEKNNRVKALVKGEKMDREKHEMETEIKAVTWHRFFVKRKGNKWVSQVLLDT